MSVRSGGCGLATGRSHKTIRTWVRRERVGFVARVARELGIPADELLAADVAAWFDQDMGASTRCTYCDHLEGSRRGALGSRGWGFEADKLFEASFEGGDPGILSVGPLNVDRCQHPVLVPD